MRCAKMAIRDAPVARSNQRFVLAIWDNSKNAMDAPVAQTNQRFVLATVAQQ